MRALRWLVAAATLAPVVLLAPGGQAAGRADATLRKGQAAFWAASPTRRDYVIDVKQSSWRLRVSYDHPDFREWVSGELYDPAGKRVTSLSGYMSGEAYVPNPMRGRWVLKMFTPPGYRGLRMRAKLEDRPRKPAKARQLLPNLQLVPPYEFTFASYLSGGRGIYATGGQNPATSCTLDDVAEQRGVRCLRFSVGPANVGEGPLRLVFPPLEGLALPGKASQVISWSDGRETTRPAGEFEYHKTHAHYHHTGFGKLELFKVTDPSTGAMTAAGSGPKQGFCTADVKLAQWTTFGGEQHSAGTTCEDEAGQGYYDPTRGTVMGLSAGWIDIYSWEQDGNFVEFGVNGDGRYVVRSTADALNHVLETNESDNTSYAYVEITGQTIKVLERGRGSSPWDRRKVVVADGLYPNAKT